MSDLEPHEVEQLRRSVAMLPAQSVAGLDREDALQVLDQLRRCLERHPSSVGRESPAAGANPPAP
jgi:hypothetical protein